MSLSAAEVPTSRSIADEISDLENALNKLSYGLDEFSGFQEPNKAEEIMSSSLAIRVRLCRQDAEENLTKFLTIRDRVGATL